MFQKPKEFVANIPEKQLLWTAAGLSIGSGVIHGVVTPEHFEEWWGYGLFFTLTALIQLFYGMLLIFQPWQPDPIRKTQGLPVQWLYWAGIFGTVLIILLYVITRTVGIPFFGPEAGEVEDLSLISLLSKVLELGLIVCLLLLLRRSKSNEA